MKRLTAIVVVLVVMAVGYLAYTRLFPPDRVRIRRLIVAAADAASWDAGAGALAQLAAASRLAGYCTSDVVVEFDSGGGRTLRGRDEVQQAAAAARSGASALRVEVMDLEVRVQEDRRTASAQLVASLRVGQSSEPLVQEVRVGLAREDRQWRIARVEMVRGFGM